jgi:hypothetical protein
MDNMPDYIVEWVLCNPAFHSASVGAFGAQVLACADKGWLTMYYDPANGKKYEDKSLIVTRTCASMPQDASLGERAVLEALFGPGLTRETQALKPFKHRRMTSACWKVVRRGMLDAGMLEREDEATYQKKRFLRVGIVALIVAALVGVSVYVRGIAGIVAIPFAVIAALVGLYFLVRPKGWHVTEGNVATCDKALARNDRVIHHYKDGPVDLFDALAAGAPYFTNPPLHEIYTRRPSWFSSTPEVEAEVGGGFFIAAPLLLTVFCDRPGGGRDSAGSA